ncbi:MAG: hypothetical protein WAP06_00435 [Defluviitoga tunisiensis]
MIEIKVKVEGLDEVINLLKKLLEKENMLQKEKPVNEEQKDSPVTQPFLSRENVRNAFIAKNSPENSQKLKKLLMSYGAANISQLDEKYFADIIQELEAL